MRKSYIYTKTGDKGKTSLVGGTRVEKNHIRLDAYGTIDELNSFTGWLICEIMDEASKPFLSYVQHKLFTVGSHLATETEEISPRDASIIKNEDIERIEKEIDRIDNLLPKIKRFILPGGSESGARAHIGRTVSRRVERAIYDVAEKYPVEENILIFINRLSDYFFVLARLESNQSGKEIFWEQGEI